MWSFIWCRRNNCYALSKSVKIIRKSSTRERFSGEKHRNLTSSSQVYEYNPNLGFFSSCCPRRHFSTSATMAKSHWEYVKTFETDEKLLPNCWVVARVDGRGFHKLAKLHDWKRPNDERGLKLMTLAAKSVMFEYSDILLAYGQSDEYSFIFRREAEVFQRRSDKILTTLVSQFTSAFTFHWKEFFPDTNLLYPPSFDGRLVLYPTDENLRDYLKWRQADCHINNLYNTTFWSLVLKGNLSNVDAEKELCGTLSGDKNEILFSRFGINYNNEPELYRKGTVLFLPLTNRFLQPSTKKSRGKKKKNDPGDDSLNNAANDSDLRTRIEEHVTEKNCDIIGDTFWEEYPYLLNPNILKASSNSPVKKKSNVDIEDKA